MPATVLTAAQIRDNILRDRQNLQTDQQIDIDSDSDNFIRAAATGSAIEGLYGYGQWGAKQVFPDSADEANVIRHAALRGLYLKDAKYASGPALITGTPGVEFASGLAAKFSDGTQYVTTSGGVFDASRAATVTVRAIVAGTAGGRASGDKLTLTVPPVGVDASITVTGDTGITGGTDQETVESLLQRLLVRMRKPAAGGNKYDYWDWAMEVPGVTGAFVYPLRRGLGTIDVAIVSATGMPSKETIDAAQAHIDDVRPVSAKNSLVFAPTIKSYDVVVGVQLDGISLADATTAINSALTVYDLSIVPGASAIRNHIGGIVNDISGVVDYVLASPAANVVPDVGADKVEWCRIGRITVNPMGA
ncbi:Baseplate J family protein [Burkholderia sp. lig30]|jgi:uncharacterized phage protein gp47/JayE|uniref:baseplate J/gp47 family protein n=1 Tax=Burkholderia sp. lig30 TaxID=1192124 RepID=UPI00046177D0|nr:baseplate J/gp47 family protein [Burkholderia sp. lig30]KDB09522.1 Baseplate J family protein [Burkholderia sp. lig30]